MKRVKVDQEWKEGYVTSLEPLTVTVSLDDPTEIPPRALYEVREKQEKKGQADEKKTASDSKAETAKGTRSPGRSSSFSNGSLRHSGGLVGARKGKKDASK